MKEPGSNTSPKLKIFRASDAPGLMETGIMSIEPADELRSAGIKQMVEAGYLEGDELKVLVNLPGFSLVKAWLKKDYPLLRHSHDSDCLYYVVAGTLQLGTETLGAGDAFFVGANVPYTYTPGEDGVEVLEFRHATAFNFVNLTTGQSFYERAVETISNNVEDWRDAKPPSAR